MNYRLLFFTVLVLQLLEANAQRIPFSGSGKYQKLVWSDEFDGNGLPDTNKWIFEKGYVRNKELQYYTEGRLQNAQLKNGFLNITARNDSLKNGGEVYPITSASVTTQGKHDWTYGRIEVRAKVPSSLGTWPAIWTLGSDLDTIHFKGYSEIDIMEHVGFMPDTLHFNIHMEASLKKGHKLKNSMRVFSKAPHHDFHVYAIEWFPDHIDWYLDKTKVFSYANDGNGVSTWPFYKPQYLILNLAFGGSWGAQRGVNIASLPQTFLIDYVRVYQ